MSASAVTLDLSASQIPADEVADTSDVGRASVALFLPSSDPVTLEFVLDPAELGDPVAFAAELATLADLAPAAVAVSLSGGASFAAGGQVAENAAPFTPAPAPTSGVVTIPLDPGRPLHVLELAGWTLDTSGVDPAGRLQVQLQFIPEPGLLGGLLAGIATLALLHRRRARHGVALLLVGAALLARAGPVEASTVTVTSSADGAVGSLRERLANAVADGDTITFGVAQVQLAAPLEISAANLTLQGPVTILPQGGGPAFVDFTSNGIHVVGVTFQDVHLGTPVDNGIVDFQLTGSTLQGDSGVTIFSAAGCNLADNTISADPSGDGLGVVSLTATDGCTLSGNTITTSLRTAIYADRDTDLTIFDNTTASDIVSYQQSGEIGLNDANQIWVFPLGALPSGNLVIDNNGAKRLFVKRANVDVVHNFLAGAGGPDDSGVVAKLIHSEPGAGAGTFSASFNVVSDGRVGIFFADEMGPALASDLVNNEVNGAAVIGMTARLTGGTRIAGNSITSCGTGDTGTGLEILHARTPGLAENNTVTGTGGAGIAVVGPADAYTLDHNEVSASTSFGIAVIGGPGKTLATDNMIHDNGDAGIGVAAGVRASITSGVYQNNGDAGVLVYPSASAEISQVSMTGNAGPGIDVFPAGVTPNAETKLANLDLDWPEFSYDAASQRIVGTTVPNGRVEVYSVETGPRTGNPMNGEGQVFLGSVDADASGKFSFPGTGSIPCTPGLLLTLTATAPGADAVTSEFSPDFLCDADGDGVALGIDQCPDTPPATVVNSDGCYDTRTLPDGGHTYCNSDSSCLSTASDGTGPCIDCAYRSGDYYFDCSSDLPPDPVCVASADGLRSCSDCRIGEDDLALDCAGASCDRITDGTYRCYGDAGECDADYANGFSLRCPAEEPCDLYLEPDLSGGAFIDSITLRKVTSGADGVFLFDISEEPGFDGEISTSGAVGTKALVFGVVAYDGDPPLTIIEDLPDGWTLDSVTCNSAVAPFANGVQYQAQNGFGLECTFTNNRVVGGSVYPAGGVFFPDVIVRSNTFGLPPGNHIVIAGSNGLVVMDPLTGQIPTAGNSPLSFLGLFQYQGLLGALILENPYTADADAIFAYKATTGGSFQSYVPATGYFGITSLVSGTFSDAVHLGGDIAQPEAIATGSGGITQLVYLDYGGGQYFPAAVGNLVSAFAFSGFGTPVSGFTLPAKQRILVATSGTPGQLVLGDPASPYSAATAVGSLGDDPRRVRCLNGICAISNFGSDSLTIATWDGATSAAITATQTVGDGPVGVDLIAAGPNVLVASTGFNDDSYALTEVAPDGSIVSSVSQPAPVGCSQPGHALWLGDPAQSLILSCYGSDAIAVLNPITP